MERFSDQILTYYKNGINLKSLKQLKDRNSLIM